MENLCFVLKDDMLSIFYIRLSGLYSLSEIAHSPQIYSKRYKNLDEICYFFTFLICSSFILSFKKVVCFK